MHERPEVLVVQRDGREELVEGRIDRAGHRPLQDDDREQRSADDDGHHRGARERRSEQRDRRGRCAEEQRPT